MDIFIFTYAKDAALLPLCIGHAARHGRVVLADDAAAPACDEAEALAMGASVYVRTEFDRKGNLNGSACVRGMLELYRDYGEAEWLMQVDSNMLLFRPEVLLPGDESRVAMVGQAAGYCDAWLMQTPVHYARGGGMLLRRDRVERMLTLMDKPGIVERIDSGKAYSDHVLTALCRMCGGEVQLLRHEGAGKAERVYKRVGWYTFEEFSYLWRSAAAVHICPKCAPGETPEARAAAVLGAMQEVAETWCELPEEAVDFVIE